MAGQILALSVTWSPDLVLTVAFLVWEGKAQEPILPLYLFKNHTFSLNLDSRNDYWCRNVWRHCDASALHAGG
jgi:hypothetical protein